MRTVGIRDLKSQLSQYLRLVKAGETVLVTEHNRVIAEIALPHSSTKESRGLLEKFLADGELKGKIIRAKRTQSIVETIDVTPSINWKLELDSIREERF
jgi:antitoxin (DNA-binding transcriptional repressor) of toxin-antitoxin stability system